MSRASLSLSLREGMFIPHFDQASVPAKIRRLWTALLKGTVRFGLFSDNLLDSGFGWRRAWCLAGRCYSPADALDASPRDVSADFHGGIGRCICCCRCGDGDGGHSHARMDPLGCAIRESCLRNTARTPEFLGTWRIPSALEGIYSLCYGAKNSRNRIQ